FAVMLATLAFASGFGARQRERDTLDDIVDDVTIDDNDRGAVSLGLLFHALMSLKARLWRLTKLPYAWLVASRLPPPGLPFERHEPNLGAGAPPLAPHDQDDFAGDDDEASYDDEEEEDKEEEEAPAPRRRTARAARTPARKVHAAFELPPIGVLSQPRASD